MRCQDILAANRQSFALNGNVFAVGIQQSSSADENRALLYHPAMRR